MAVWRRHRDVASAGGEGCIPFFWMNLLLAFGCAVPAVRRSSTAAVELFLAEP